MVTLLGSYLWPVSGSLFYLMYKYLVNKHMYLSSEDKNKSPLNPPTKLGANLFTFLLGEFNEFA